MNKRKIIWGVLLWIAVLVIFIYFYRNNIFNFTKNKYFSKDKGAIVTNKIVSGDVKTKNAHITKEILRERYFDNLKWDEEKKEKLSKISKKYINTEDYKRCLDGDDKISYSCIDYAINLKFKETNDVKYCDDFIFEDEIRYCKKTYYTEKAIKYNNIKSCDNLEKQEDILVCKDNYYYNIAEQKTDVKLCDKILSKKDWKLQCKDNVLYKDAIENNKPNLCDKLNLVGYTDGREKAVKDCKDQVRLNAIYREEGERLKKIN